MSPTLRGAIQGWDKHSATEPRFLKIVPIYYLVISNNSYIELRVLLKVCIKHWATESRFLKDGYIIIIFSIYVESKRTMKI